MKRCLSCKEDKPFSEYHIRRKGSVKLQSECKSCTNSRHREWIKINRASVRAYTKQRRVAQKAKLVKQFGGKCLDCNNIFPDYVYDFHHLEPTKKDYFPAYAINQLSKVKMEAELEKCIMLCANCHRIRHHESSS